MLFQNNLIIFQMSHENTTTLDQGDIMFTTLPRFTECLRGELYMPDSDMFNNKTHTLVSLYHRIQVCII